MTPLTKPLKRELRIGGEVFVVELSAEKLRLTRKGRRKGQELRWVDLISGDAALAVALNASVRSVGAPEAGGRTQRSKGAAARPGTAAATPSAGRKTH